MNYRTVQGPRTRDAFTMIELLVAVAVLALLVVVLFSLVDGAVKLWKDNENRVDAFREARAPLNVISADLRTMHASGNRDYFSTNIVGTAANGVVEEGTLFFLSSMPPSAQPENNKSDLCAVGYFRQWMNQTDIPGQVGPAGGAVKGFHLVRAFYGSDQTYTNLSTGAKPLENLARGSGGESEILARNIVSLEFEFYESSPDFLTNTPPVGAPYQKWNPTSTALPNMVEIRIKAIPDEIAKRLDGDKDVWSDTNSAIANSLRTFVSRVTLPKPTEQPNP